jgi:hypothetical protein
MNTGAGLKTADLNGGNIITSDGTNDMKTTARAGMKSTKKSITNYQGIGLAGY